MPKGATTTTMIAKDISEQCVPPTPTTMVVAGDAALVSRAMGQCRGRGEYHNKIYKLIKNVSKFKIIKTTEQKKKMETRDGYVVVPL